MDPALQPPATSAVPLELAEEPAVAEPVRMPAPSSNPSAAGSADAAAAAAGAAHVDAGAGAAAKVHAAKAHGGGAHAHTPRAHAQEVESIDYEAPITFAAKAILRDQRQLELARRERFAIPALLIGVGITVALVISLIHWASYALLEAKRDLVAHAIATAGLSGGFGAFVGFSVLCAALAALTVELIAPSAGGGGMAYVLLLLNGTHVKEAFTPQTLVAKTFGLVFVAGSGLACGLEGPMIHLGAIIGSHLYRAAAVTVVTRLSVLHGRGRALIDFAGCGVAAALASAFLAPIGGVLLVMEELGTFWSRTLLIRLFLTTLSAAAVARFFFALKVDAVDIDLRISYESLLEADSDLLGDYPRGVYLGEFVAFGAMGVIGGVAGIVFNAGGAKLQLLRELYVTTRGRRLFDAVVLSVITSILFWLAAASWECQPLDADDAPGIVLKYANTLGCAAPYGAYGKGGGGGAKYAADGKKKYPSEFNPLATLLLSPTLASAEMLLSVQHRLFSAQVCLAYGATYSIMCLALLGCVVPHGLLDPTMAIGAAFGRALGMAAEAAAGVPLTHGVFGLVGASAFVAGTSHTTIAFTMIIVELVNDTSFLVPCVVAALIARAVSSHFGSGSYYETLLELHGHPFLEQADEERPELNLLTAADVMAKNPITVHATERLSSLVRLCSRSQHHGFPIVDGGREPRVNPALLTEHGQGEDGPPPPPEVNPHFIGFVTHERIIDVLRRTFERDNSDAGSHSKFNLRASLGHMHGPRMRTTRVVTSESALDATAAGGSVPPKSKMSARAVAIQLEAAELTTKLLKLGIVADPLRVTAHADDWIDLRAESDIVPHVLGEGAPIRVLLQNFIRLGARHVTVIDRSRHVVGIVTRADVMPEVLHHVLDDMTQEIRSARAMALGTAATDNKESMRGGSLSEDAKRRVALALKRARKCSAAGSTASSETTERNGLTTPPLGQVPPSSLRPPRDRASTWGGRQIVREMMSPLGTIPQDTPSNAGIYDAGTDDRDSRLQS